MGQRCEYDHRIWSFLGSSSLMHDQTCPTLPKTEVPSFPLVMLTSLSGFGGVALMELTVRIEGHLPGGDAFQSDSPCDGLWDVQP